MNQIVGPFKLTEEAYIAESVAISREMYAKRMKLNVSLGLLVIAAGLGMGALLPRGSGETLGGVYVVLGLLYIRLPRTGEEDRPEPPKPVVLLGNDCGVSRRRIRSQERQWSN